MNPVLDVKLEFVFSEGWQTRLLQAFEMLVGGNDAPSLTKGSLDGIIGAQEKEGMNK